MARSVLRTRSMLAVLLWFVVGALAALLAIAMTGRDSKRSSFESVLTGFCGALAGGASVGHGGLAAPIGLASSFTAFVGAVLFLGLSILLTPGEEH